VSELFHHLGGVFHPGGQDRRLSSPDAAWRLVRLVQRSGRQRLAVTGGFLAMAVLATAFYYVVFAKGTALLLSSVAGVLSGAIPLHDEHGRSAFSSMGTAALARRSARARPIDQLRQ
jgi:hypothetical protein